MSITTMACFLFLGVSGLFTYWKLARTIHHMTPKDAITQFDRAGRSRNRNLSIFQETPLSNLSRVTKYFYRRFIWFS
jgi:hypothetical protein